jgi:hypothetical protein
LGVEVSVTLLSGDGGALTRRCVVNHDLVEPFHTDQGLLNLVLLVPVGFFAVLAVRSIAPVAALVVLLPVATELLQSLVPAIGRLCDTSDVEMNVLGGALGAAACRLLLRTAHQPLPRPDAGARTTGKVAAVAAVVVAALWTGLITQIPEDSTSLQIAGSTEKDAAQQAFHQAFGDRYRLVTVQYQPSFSGSQPQLLITLEHGSATLSWPDRKELVVSLESSSAVTPFSFPVPGASVAPRTAAAAVPIATRYAQTHFPWALRNSQVLTEPVGAEVEFGWVVSWRRRNADGVLMPMRLDVEIDRGGRVSQLLARDVADPAHLPVVRVPEKSAQRTAVAYDEKLAEAAKSPTAGTTPHVTGHELLAIQGDGHWRTQWLFSMSSGPSHLYVDATDGTVTMVDPQQSLTDPDFTTDQQAGSLSDGPPPSAH